MKTGQEKQITVPRGRHAAEKQFIRHRSKPAPVGVTTAGFKRAAQRAGITRLSRKIYDYLRARMVLFLTGVLNDTTIMAKHAAKKTVTIPMVVTSLGRRNIEMYGFNHMEDSARDNKRSSKRSRAK